MLSEPSRQKLSPSSGTRARASRIASTAFSSVTSTTTATAMAPSSRRRPYRTAVPSGSGPPMTPSEAPSFSTPKECSDKLVRNLPTVVKSL